MQDVIQNYIDSFENFLPQVEGKEPFLLTQKRKNSIHFLKQHGFPTSKNEEFKYLKMGELAKQAFTTQKKPIQNFPDIQPLLLTKQQSINLVFVDGIFNENLSDLSHLPEGLVVSKLILTDSNLATLANPEKDAFTALNTAFIKEGLSLRITKNTRMVQPIHIIHVTTSAAKELLIPLHHFIHCEPHAEAFLVETYTGIDSASYFTNVITEIKMEADSKLTHIKIQEEGNQAHHLATTALLQEKSSSVGSWIFSRGALTHRTSIQSTLDDVDCSFDLKALLLAKEGQQTDIHARVDHLKPHGTSNMELKNIVNDQARGIINSKVVVHPNAQKTKAHQSLKHLMLSENAEANPKPELEIYANDVQCNHGASIGQLDPQAMFYLRSRGIGQQEAQTMLTYAFAEELIQTIPLKSLRTKAMESVLKWQKQEKTQS